MTALGRRMISRLFAGALLVALAGPSCTCQPPVPEIEPVTIYLIRHAEKQTIPDDAPEADKKDPPLSRVGQLRALGLADDLPIAELDGVYVTDFQRSRQTASAVLAVTGLEPIVYPAKDSAGLAARLRERTGEQLLVVGHSNTVPLVLQALGVTDEVVVDEQQYGDMWVVTVPGEGPVTVEVRRYGEQPPRAETLR